MSLVDAQKALKMVERARAKGRTADIFFTRTETDFIPGVGGGTTTDEWNTFAVVLPAKRSAVDAFDVQLDNGTLIESLLRSLLIPALACEKMPKGGDTCTFPDGVKATVLGCTPLNVDAANPIIYRTTVKL